MIISGICLPLIFLPFVSGYEKDKNMIQNIFKISIILKKEKQNTGETAVPSSFVKMIPGKLPFRFVLAAGIFLIFVGIVKIDTSRRKKSDLKP